MKGTAVFSGLMSGVLALGAFLPIKAVAQISSDGTTNTTVDQNGSNFTITNGIKKGSNLFHSFRDFSLPGGGSANFDLNRTPNINNIFSRVTGGNISHIDGLIQTINGNNSVNLFLINPAGIIFGENAVLNVNGSFLGTTANSVVFKDGLEFSAINNNTKPLLTVDVPLGLQYGVNPAPIQIQDSNITVAAGNNFSLYGGEVIINNGRLAAPQGNLKFASIKQPGLVKFNSNYEQINNFGDISVDADSRLSAGNMDVRGNNLQLSGQLISENNLNLNATDTVTIGDISSNPFIAVAGGELVLQGKQNLDIFALNHPNSGLFAGGDLILRSSNPVIGDAHYYSGGNFRIEQLDGSLGNLLSDKDPIIRSQGDVSFNNYQGASLHIIAGGEVSFNTAIITGADTTNNTINPVNTPELSSVSLSDGTELEIDGSRRPTLDVRAGVDSSVIGNPVSAVGGLFLDSNSTAQSPPSVNNPATGSGISIGDVSIEAADGLVLLTNQYHPNPNLTAGDITIRADGGGGIITGAVAGNAGDIIIDSRGGINVTGSVSASALSGDDSFLGPHTGNGGNIKLLADRDFQLSPGSEIASYGLLGGNIELSTPGDIALAAGRIDTLSSASNSTSDTLSGGNINIQANNLFLTQGTQLGVNINGIVDGGDINVEITESIEIDERALISDNILPGAQGNGGEITISARDVELTNGGQIRVFRRGEGEAGNINLTVDNNLKIDGNPFPGALFSPSGVLSQSFLFTPTSGNPSGKGNTGDVTITARDVQVTNGGRISANAVGTGDTGNITITAQDVQLTDGGQISGNVFGEGNAGNINLTVTNTLKIEGRDPVTPSASGIGSFVAFVTTNRNATGKGNGGDITITAQDVQLNSGSSINVFAIGEGNAGNVNLTATGKIEMDIGSISSRVSSGGTGNAGRLIINSPVLTLDNEAIISTSTSGIGNAGTIDLQISDSVRLNNQSIITSSSNANAVGLGGDINIQTPLLELTDSQITAASESQSAAGSVQVDSQQLNLNDGATISVSGSGSGGAGNLIVNSDRINLNNQASLQAEVAGGSQGNISLDSQLLQLRRNSNITTNATNTANGGNININSPVIVGFENSDIVANAVEGNGGNINITTQGIFGLQFRPNLTAENDITASSELGIDGTVDINNFGIDPNNGVVELPTGLVDSSQRIAKGCSSKVGNTFVVTGRGGIPQNPSEKVTVNRAWSDIRDLSAYPQATDKVAVTKNQESNQVETAIVEASRLIRNSQGEIELVSGEHPSLGSSHRLQTQEVTCSG